LSIEALLTGYKTRLDNLPRGASGKRSIPYDLKRDIINTMSQFRLSPERASRLIGVSTSILYRWQRQFQTKGQTPFTRVAISRSGAIKPDHDTGTFWIKAAGGFEIHGLQRHDVIALLRELKS
jgi:hypothetical protein